MPEIASLLCLSPAAEGGIRRFCLLYTVHDRPARRHLVRLWMRERGRRGYDG